MPECRRLNDVTTIVRKLNLPPKYGVSHVLSGKHTTDVPELPSFTTRSFFKAAVCADQAASAAMLKNQKDLQAFLSSQEATGIAPVSDADYSTLQQMML